MEIEVKLRISDRRALLRQLRRLKAKPAGGRVHEMNTLYDTAEGTLARHGQMLRIRVERPAGRAAGVERASAKRRSGGVALLTYKGPAREAAKGAGKRSRYKIREERELHILNPEELGRILEELGLKACFRYEKFRTEYRLPGSKRLKVDVDETPIGLFVELEGPQREIDRAARLLGFGPSDYINKSYAAVFMEERGLARAAAASAGQGRDAANQNEPASFACLPDMLFRRSR